MNPRQTALEVLTGCRKKDGWSNALLKTQISVDGLDKRDAALATRICYGVVQNRRLLDYYCDWLLNGKRNRLRPVVRDILHMGLYQIFMMDKIPDSAAVNESVKLAKRYCKKEPHIPALVNGVLRNAVRNAENRPCPEDLGIQYSHPENLMKLLKSYVGEERLLPMLQANNAAPETVIQVNTNRITSNQLLDKLEEEGVHAHLHPWLENCLVFSGSGSIDRLPSFQQGLFYVQDAAAKLAVDCASISPEKLLVTDCCGAPGGKSFAAAIAMKGKGKILTSDLYPHKIELVHSGARRMGFDCIESRTFDASVFDPALESGVDVALVDVPCSGYGIIRKKPDIREKDPDTMKNLPELQLAIIQNQARYVRFGGILLYSTCTLVRRENEGVIEKFLKSNPEFYPEPLVLPDVFPENKTGMLTLVPGEYDTDGFFICRLRRKA